MNTRIQQMIFIINDKADGYWTNHDKLKFAELIIRECMEQVRDEVQYAHDWELADKVTQRVMEHFGWESEQ